MNINIYHQVLNLFTFTITGIVIGILFDIFRITRRSFKTPDFITYVEDILFWILTGIILLFTIFTFNNGEIRLYIFVSLVLGLILYMITLSKHFVKINVILLKFIKKILYIPIHMIINFTNRCILQPFSFIFQKAKENMSKWIKKPIKKAENTNFANICNKIDK